VKEKKLEFCEWVEEEGERGVLCPFFIPGLGESHYCGYYGTDIGESKKRLAKCDIEAVIKTDAEKVSRRVEKQPFLEGVIRR